MSDARRSAAAAVVVLLVLGLLWPRERSRHGADSFGTGPDGQGALFELLVELGLEVSRSFAAPAALDPGSVVWWIEPEELCASGPGAEPGAWQPDDWLRRGGTALVFLPADLPAEGCRRLGPHELPPLARAETAAEEDDAPAAGASEAAQDPEPWWRGGADPAASPDPGEPLEGELLPRPRRLPGPRLARFADAGELTVRAGFRSSTGGLEPFALERAVGDGRLVVFADGRFLRNAWLDRGDAAPLVLDLVRAFGTPSLDERAHGLRAEQRPHVYLARSAALPVFAGLLLLGGLALWWGNALPRRAVAEVDPDAPELERFVSSLAALYARSRDYPALARRYREASLAGLRRGLGLAPDTPAATLVARLRAEGRLGETGATSLARDPEPPVASAAALRAFARRLDALVKEAQP